LRRTICKYLKAQNINWYVTLSKIRHNALDTFVKLGSDDHNLMRLVQRVFIEHLAKARTRIIGKALTGLKAPVFLRGALD
jgi:glycerol-3-phosphate O-acyltransferase